MSDREEDAKGKIEEAKIFEQHEEEMNAAIKAYYTFDDWKTQEESLVIHYSTERGIRGIVLDHPAKIVKELQKYRSNYLEAYDKRSSLKNFQTASFERFKNVIDHSVKVASDVLAKHSKLREQHSDKLVEMDPSFLKVQTKKLNDLKGLQRQFSETVTDIPRQISLFNKFKKEYREYFERRRKDEMYTMLISVTAAEKRFDQLKRKLPPSIETIKYLGNLKKDIESMKRIFNAAFPVIPDTGGKRKIKYLYHLMSSKQKKYAKFVEKFKSFKENLAKAPKSTPNESTPNDKIMAIIHLAKQMDAFQNNRYSNRSSVTNTNNTKRILRQEVENIFTEIEENSGITLENINSFKVALGILQKQGVSIPARFISSEYHPVEKIDDLFKNCVKLATKIKSSTKPNNEDLKQLTTMLKNLYSRCGEATKAEIAMIKVVSKNEKDIAYSLLYNPEKFVKDLSSIKELESLMDRKNNKPIGDVFREKYPEMQVITHKMTLKP